MKIQKYNVIYWPIGDKSKSQTIVIEADGKEDCLDRARRSIGVNFTFQIKRRNYNWTGRGVVHHAQKRWAEEAKL